MSEIASKTVYNNELSVEDKEVEFEKRHKNRF